MAKLSVLRKKDSPMMSNNDDVDAFKVGLELKLKTVSITSAKGKIQTLTENFHKCMFLFCFSSIQNDNNKKAF